VLGQLLRRRGRGHRGRLLCGLVCAIRRNCECYYTYMDSKKRGNWYEVGNVLAHALEEICHIAELDQEPGTDVAEEVIGPVFVALLFDEFGEGQGGPLGVFSVLDVFA
jgi:hypothetical protein